MSHSAILHPFPPRGLAPEALAGPRQRILVAVAEAGLGGRLVRLLHQAGLPARQLSPQDPALPAEAAASALVLLGAQGLSGGGMALLAMLRRASEVPVILLAAQPAEAEFVLALEAGADDCVLAETRPRELVARIRALLRRAARPGAIPPAEALVVGDVRLSLRLREAWRSGRPLGLTTAEFDLLACFLRSPGTPLPRAMLAQAALGVPPGGAGLRNLDNLVSKLRRKLGPGDAIRTLRNTGYLYAAD
ncbi:response regulator transcription factor [Siccirubricoccus phaeus]|uniref:response regulator transcription factor n=1 Tax=Siccirubricoccus phaeus TaxID=2595053 RepID=UPI0011F3E4DE|nr:response regulator transcription factor [Siccirubricoccus phaeus]